jgi:hypothetical protein
MFKSYPFEGRKAENYRHVVAFRPNGCIQVDILDLGEKYERYRLARYYILGVDVYSRYTCIRVCTDKEGNPAKKDIAYNFINLIEMFSGKPDMVVADAEFNIKGVIKYCEEKNIKLVIVPTGTINTNSVVEKMIDKIKSLLSVYKFQFIDDMERRVKRNIPVIKHSYQVMNAILYFLNRKFHTAVKGVPIEIYMGIESPSFPIRNPDFLEYPEFEPGQYVLLRPRGRYKSYKFKEGADTPGIPGIIKGKAPDTKRTYVIKTIEKPPNDEINAKWYEFVPITEEEYKKAVKLYLIS